VSGQASRAETRDRMGRLLLGRVHRIENLPPPGFDPLATSAEQLAKFQLPPRPDAERQPRLFSAWRRLFAPPVRFIEPRLALVETDFQLNPHAGQPRELPTSVGRTRYGTNRNWSGASIVPTGGTMIVLQTGVWVVPAPGLPAAPDLIPAPASGARYACSTWIGLDGQRRYLNSSLPQIGTTQTLTPSPSGQWEVGAFAWFQWWDRLGGMAFILLGGLTVANGDLVTATIWVPDSTQVVAYMRNLGTNELAWVVAELPTVLVGGKPVRLTVTGATAEWIMERPTYFGSTDLYPFPDYGETEFTDCVAGVAPRPGGTFGQGDLSAARLIRMYEVRDNPPRTAFISMARKHGTDAVRLVHGGF
jgi:Peptidase A4 family